VVVIGGGAVGVCCAYALARSGRGVRLLERERLSAGSSWGNSGLITTSACAPEAAPGVMRQAARWMLDSNGPFRLRPRLDPRFARWLWRFRSFCTAEAAQRSTAFLRDRVRENAGLLDSIAGESARDFGWRRNGLITLYASEHGLEEGLRGAAALRELEIPSEHLDAEAVAREEPRVTGSVVGGILYPEDAHVVPGEFVDAVADLARARGARIDEGTGVVRLVGSRRVDSVETTSGVLTPEVVVLANGAWSRPLAAALRVDLPVEAGKGFSLTYDAGGERFQRPLRLWEVRTVVSSMGANVRVTSKMDLVGLDPGVRERRIRPSGDQAARYLGMPAGLAGARSWAGLRPLTPDGLPLVGRSRRIDNLVVATGHGHLGISLAAVTGEAVAAIVSGGVPSFDATPLRPERFDA
jgi:D-amino-acid dehydrogenase